MQPYFKPIRFQHNRSDNRTWHERSYNLDARMNDRPNYTPSYQNEQFYEKSSTVVANNGSQVRLQPKMDPRDKYNYNFLYNVGSAYRTETSRRYTPSMMPCYNESFYSGNINMVDDEDEEDNGFHRPSSVSSYNMGNENDGASTSFLFERMKSIHVSNDDNDFFLSDKVSNKSLNMKNTLSYQKKEYYNQSSSPNYYQSQIPYNNQKHSPNIPQNHSYAKNFTNYKMSPQDSYFHSPRYSPSSSSLCKTASPTFKISPSPNSPQCPSPQFQKSSLINNRQMSLQHLPPSSPSLSRFQHSNSFSPLTVKPPIISPTFIKSPVEQFKQNHLNYNHFHNYYDRNDNQNNKRNDFYYNNSAPKFISQHQITDWDQVAQQQKEKIEYLQKQHHQQKLQNSGQIHTVQQQQQPRMVFEKLPKYQQRQQQHLQQQLIYNKSLSQSQMTLNNHTFTKHNNPNSANSSRADSSSYNNLFFRNNYKNDEIQHNRNNPPTRYTPQLDNNDSSLHDNNSYIKGNNKKQHSKRVTTESLNSFHHDNQSDDINERLHYYNVRKLDNESDSKSSLHPESSFYDNVDELKTNRVKQKRIKDEEDEEVKISNKDVDVHENKEEENVESVAKRLYRLEGFKKQQVSPIINKPTEKSKGILGAYLKHFDFTNLSLETSLRSFLTSVHVTGESQERERILEGFSKRFISCNPSSFNSFDACHTLVCAMFLLNTDLHSQNIGKRMTQAQFINNLRGTDEGNQYDVASLKHIYNAISKTPLPIDNVIKQEEKSKKANKEVLSSSNPFIQPAQGGSGIVFKRGVIMRKACVAFDGKKIPLGKRGWKYSEAILKDTTLIFSKEVGGPTEDTMADFLPVFHSLAYPAKDYIKKKHVFELRLASWAVYLIKTNTEQDCQQWMQAINLASSLLSAPPLPAPVGSNTTFTRPLLPSSITKLSLADQLKSHEEKLKEVTNELAYHHDNLVMSSKSNRERSEKESYLLYERLRYQTYVQILKENYTKLEERHRVKENVNNNDESSSVSGSKSFVTIHSVRSVPTIVFETKV